MIVSSARRCSSLSDPPTRSPARSIAAAGAPVFAEPARQFRRQRLGPRVVEGHEEFDELAAPYEELGFDEFVLHHPAQTGPYGGSVAVFEQIAARQSGGG